MGRRTRQNQQTVQPSPRTRRVFWLAGALILLAAIAIATPIALQYSRARVSWVRVLSAGGDTRTLHCVARFLPNADDKTEWAYALWARVDGPGDCPSKGMLAPIITRRQALRPAPETLALCDALNLYGKRGIITKLAEEGLTSHGRWTEWNGATMLEVAVSRSLPPARRSTTWRFYLDPETKLARGLEVFVDGDLRVRASYEYGKALPQNFRPEAE